MGTQMRQAAHHVGQAILWQHIGQRQGQAYLALDDVGTGDTEEAGGTVPGFRFAGIGQQLRCLAVERFVMRVYRHFQPAAQHRCRDCGGERLVHLRFLLAQVGHVQRGVQLFAHGVAIQPAGLVAAHCLQTAALGGSFHEHIEHLLGGAAISLRFSGSGAFAAFPVASDAHLLPSVDFPV